MLNKDYVLAKLGFDTAKNDPRQVCCVLRARGPSFGIVSGLGLRRIWRGSNALSAAQLRNDKGSADVTKSSKQIRRRVNAHRGIASPTRRCLIRLLMLPLIKQATFHRLSVGERFLQSFFSWRRFLRLFSSSPRITVMLPTQKIIS